MPADDRFTTRAYRDGDEEAILQLFARAFPHAPRTMAHFRWKYRQSPFGNARISLTFDRERLVGHYAGYPVPFRMEGRDLEAHQIGDTMTDVSVRNAGRGPTSVFGRTAAHFYEHFCERRVGFNYGFNVANVQKFSIRFLRATRVEPVTYRRLDVRRLPPLPRWQRRALGYQLEVVTEAGPSFDAFFARVAPAYGFLVRRNAAYLRWRYLETPEKGVVVVAIRKWRRLAGWVAYRVRDRSLLLGDALFAPAFDDALPVLLRHVVAGLPVETVEGWFPPRPRWLDRILRETGFVIAPEPQELSVMCVPFLLGDAPERMARSLYYTWGDSDLF